MAKYEIRQPHIDRAGFSIPAAAAELGIGEGTIRRAVDKGQIRMVEFGGLRRIPRTEIERVREALGLEPPAAVGRPPKRRLIDAAE